MLPKSAVALAFLLPFSAFAFSPGAQLSPAFAQAAEDAPSGKLEQIIPGHYVYSNGARISGIIATDEGVLVLDALTEPMARDERRLIASRIGGPIRYLVSSTFHGNYSEGNVLYPEAVKIGHENYRLDLIDMMKADRYSTERQAAMLPDQTFRDHMSLYLGGKEIQILYLGRGHTRGDAVVFVPSDRIVYLSELFFDNRFPFMNSGSIDWINTLDIALKLDADIFVPGQGPSSIASDPKGSREALVRARQVLVDFRDAVENEIARGATEDEAVASVALPQYQNMTGYRQQRALLVRTMYRNLKGTNS